MIEMRWILVSVPAPQYGENIAETVKVLQYRQLVTYSVADGNLHTQLIDKQPVWSDWIDVPTVTE